MYDIRNSLSSIMLHKRGICRSQSYENLRGEKGQAAQTSSVLGKARKGTPFRLELQPDEIFELADITGCGVIRQFFITVTDQQEKGSGVLEKLILRMYWEDEEVPSVECPLGVFFCCGHRKVVMTDMEPWVKQRKGVNQWGNMPVRTMINHSPMIIVPARSFHCYFPMAFYRHARITLENCYGAAVSVVAYQVTYTLEEDEICSEKTVDRIDSVHDTQKPAVNGKECFVFADTETAKYTHFHAKYVEGKWEAAAAELPLGRISVQPDHPGMKQKDDKSEGKEPERDDAINRKISDAAEYAGSYLSARCGENVVPASMLLKITSLDEDRNVWYEPIYGEKLANGGWSSFRMGNPILFEQELDLSLVPFCDTINAEMEVQSVIYWYQ